ncbi:MAG: hypothetical protein ACP5NV_02085 [Candidatus Woesearchaeota archaeon]
MNDILMLILFGMFGGLIRAIVGLLKNKVFSGKQKFKKGKFAFTLGASALLGAFCAMLLWEDYRLALLAGYAGTDFIQGLYRVFK